MKKHDILFQAQEEAFIQALEEEMARETPDPNAIRAILDRAAVLRSEGNKVIPLSAGEPNFNTPAPIKEAVKKAIDENYSHYGSNRGLAELRQILSAQNARETGVTYDPETEVFITSSGAEAINNAIEELRADGTLSELSEKYFGQDISSEN